MKLTAREAVEKSIELWEWLAETGGEKDCWPEWKEYGYVQSLCFLCEFDAEERNACEACPYHKHYECYCDDDDTPFFKWAEVKTNPHRKKYAKLFLEQLKTILKEME